MNDRSMEYVAGALRFFWRITDDVIRVFDDRTHRYLADLHITGRDGEILPFEQTAFEGFCDWFLLGAAGKREPDDPSEGLELESEMEVANVGAIVGGAFVVTLAVLCIIFLASH
jgi:hypothetical protein